MDVRNLVHCWNFLRWNFFLFLFHGAWFDEEYNIWNCNNRWKLKRKVNCKYIWEFSSCKLLFSKQKRVSKTCCFRFVAGQETGRWVETKINPSSVHRLGWRWDRKRETEFRGDDGIRRCYFGFVERLVERVVGKGESWKNVRKRRTAPFFHPPVPVHDLRPVLSLRSFFLGREREETVVR